MTNCKAELKLKWRKYFVLFVTDKNSVNNIGSDDTIFTIKDIKSYLLVVALSAKDIKKYIKNHYRLILVDLRKLKELDADPKAN